MGVQSPSTEATQATGIPRVGVGRVLPAQELYHKAYRTQYGRSLWLINSTTVFSARTGI